MRLNIFWGNGEEAGDVDEVEEVVEGLQRFFHDRFSL